MTDIEHTATRAEILAIRLDNNEVVTRQEAQAAGVTRYYTGKPCIRGHVAMRLTSNGRCIECHRQKDKDRRNGVNTKRTAVVEELKDKHKAEYLAKINKEPGHMRIYAAEALQREITASSFAIQEIINEMGGR